MKTHSVLTVFVFALLSWMPALASAVNISTVNYPPYHIQNPGSEGRNGLSVDIAEAAFNEVGMSSSVSYIPMSRAEWSLVDKNHEAMLGTIQWFSESPKFSSIEAVDLVKIRFVFFYKKDKFPGGLNYTDFSELQSYVIGSVRGSSTIPFLNSKKLNIKQLNTIESSFQMLYSDRVDLVAAVDLSGWTILKKLYPEDIGQFSTANKPFIEALASIMFLNDNQDLISQFRKGLQIIVSNGLYDKLLTDYYGSNQEKNLAIPDGFK